MQIKCKYTGIRGFVRINRYGLKWQYMITDKAKQKVKILSFFDEHGLKATKDAFGVGKSTIYLWKQKLKDGNSDLEALNDKSRAPRTKRQREWHPIVKDKIRELRREHPNLGKDKIYEPLLKYCLSEGAFTPCPKVTTIGRLIKDAGGLRTYPHKVYHFGQIKPVKRAKVIRKPKDFKPEHAGHLVALDTVERFVSGLRRYLITFEDIYTRFSFAWSTTSHASKAAQEFFDYCLMVFPHPITYVLTDNGSEFKKHFNAKLMELHLTHWHTYPKTPKMNAHCERFNRTIQEEFVDYHESELLNPAIFNQRLMKWLIWYNAERPHFAFQNKLSPLQYMLSLEKVKNPEKSNMWWTHTWS